MDGDAQAMRAVEQYLERRRRGEDESEAAFLAQHPELLEVLKAMLRAATGGATGAAPTASTHDPTDTPWRGLPSCGEIVGGYRVERILGQGGMGVVFLAEDMRLGRKVALKLVRPERLGSDAARERFWREAKLAARLEHAHICAVYEVGEALGVPFMAMRYLEGETLAARIAARATAPAAEHGTTTASRIDGDIERTVHLIERVALALHYAHERGVVHRDIKPANILIDAQGDPFVLDFGMARDVEDDWALTMTGELVGTPLYMPPEQIAPKKGRALDRRADVFSLGVTLYEALTGVPPFDGASIRELLDAIVRHTPPPARRCNARVPHDLDVVLAKAIEKHPDRRYRTAAEFAEDLRRVRAREPVRARRAGLFLRSWLWIQRNPVAASFFVVVATALGVIAYLYVRERQSYQREVQARSDYDLVSLVPRLRDLKDEEKDLYANWPNHVSAVRAWEQRAVDLLADAHSVEVAHARLARVAQSGVAAAGQTERFVRETLGTFLRELAAFSDGKTGLLARVRRNLAWSEHAEEATITQQRAAWDATIDAIAASPRYGGLRLSAQIDLIPLGHDLVSELFEFGHPRSGRVPTRGADGKLGVAEDTGLVFVLLPGGRFWMGCQKDDPAQPNFDKLAREVEGPVELVSLGAFFISKYEMTQSQWMALGDQVNPSGWQPDAAPVTVTLAHPVEKVSWTECVELLAPYGLLLPTEAQWEYACRGGTTTPWWTGSEDLSLSGKVNCADSAARNQHLAADLRLHDGYMLHAPVDALAANPFGLHHVAGNVLEWCQDVMMYYHEAQPRAEDGLRIGPVVKEHVYRGGDYTESPLRCRSTHRRQGNVDQRVNTLGLRPARRVLPPQ